MPLCHQARFLKSNPSVCQTTFYHSQLHFTAFHISCFGALRSNTKTSHYIQTCTCFYLTSTERNAGQDRQRGRTGIRRRPYLWRMWHGHLACLLEFAYSLFKWESWIWCSLTILFCSITVCRVSDMRVIHQATEKASWVLQTSCHQGKLRTSTVGFWSWWECSHCIEVPENSTHSPHDSIYRNKNVYKYII